MRSIAKSIFLRCERVSGKRYNTTKLCCFDRTSGWPRGAPKWLT
jgi:hypothetical protein